MEHKKRFTKTRVTVFLIVVAIGVVVSNIYSGLHQRPQAQTPPTVAIPGGGTTPPNSGSSQPSTNGGSPRSSSSAGKQGGTENVSVRAAVEAAALAQAEISETTFGPTSRMKYVISHLVVPSRVTETEKVLTRNGRYLNAVLGWPSLADAQLSANYSVTPRLYKVDQLRGGSLIVSLFTISSISDSTGTSHTDLSISVLHMQNVRGHWLYVESHGTKPSTIRTLSLAQNMQRFQPYLRGFKQL